MKFVQYIDELNLEKCNCKLREEYPDLEKVDVNECIAVKEIIEHYEKRIIYLEKLVKKYKYDVLTGLMGRKDFEELLDLLFEEHLFNESEFTLSMIDIDDLHNINRTKGYFEGDRVIQKVSEDLKERFEFFQIYRVSGDEFCVLVRESYFDYETVQEKLKEIENVTYSIIKSNGFDDPASMFNYVDTEIVKKKNERKRL